MLQGLLAVIVLPALDAGLQAVVMQTSGGQAFNWSRTGGLAATAAFTAALMAVTAYVHRAAVDPSLIPSAQPPRPPGTTAAQAPATEPVDHGR